LLIFGSGCTELLMAMQDHLSTTRLSILLGILMLDGNEATLPESVLQIICRG